MSEGFVSVMNIIMTAFTSITVAVIGTYQTKKLKETAEYSKLKDEKEKLIREKEESRLERIEQSISDISNEVSTLSSEMDMQKIETQLHQLHVLNEVNFEFVQSLSNVVSAVGKTISSSSVIDAAEKTEMEKELKDHKAKESNITNKLYKIMI